VSDCLSLKTAVVAAAAACIHCDNWLGLCHGHWLAGNGSWSFRFSQKLGSLFLGLLVRDFFPSVLGAGDESSSMLLNGHEDGKNQALLVRRVHERLVDNLVFTADSAKHAIAGMFVGKATATADNVVVVQFNSVVVVVGSCHDEYLLLL